MNKLARFNGFGIEDEGEDKDKSVTTAEGDTSVTVNAEPPKDNQETTDETTAPEATAETEEQAGSEELENTAKEEEGQTEESGLDEDLEIKEDDSEEVVEEKEKKIKIEIEIAQEQIDAASKAIASLEDIYTQMDQSLPKGGLTVQGRNIAKTALTDVCKKFKIEVPTTSLESHGYQIDDYHATMISVEGLKDSIMKMIEFIKEKIKAMLDFMFKRATIKKLEKDIEQQEVKIATYALKYKDQFNEIIKLENKFYKAEKDKHISDIELAKVVLENNTLKDKISKLDDKKYMVDTILPINGLILDLVGKSNKHEIYIFDLFKFVDMIHDQSRNRTSTSQIEDFLNKSSTETKMVDVRFISNKESFLDLHGALGRSSRIMADNYKHIEADFKETLSHYDKEMNKTTLMDTSFKLPEERIVERVKEFKDKILYTEKHYQICEKLIALYRQAALNVVEV